MTCSGFLWQSERAGGHGTDETLADEGEIAVTFSTGETEVTLRSEVRMSGRPAPRMMQKPPRRRQKNDHGSLKMFLQTLQIRHAVAKCVVFQS